MSENNLDSENEETIEESMQATLDEMRKEEEPEEEKEPEAEPKAEEEPSDNPEEESDEGGAGDSEESDQDTELSDTDAEESDSEDGEQAASDQEADTPSSELKTDHPPSTWRAAAKAKWKDLDPAIRDEVKKREGEMIAGVNAVKEKASAFDQISQITQPYEALIRSKGANTNQVLSSMLNTYYQLESAPADQKKNLFIQLAQNYGVDLGIKQDQMTQALAPLQREIQELRFGKQQEQQAAQQRAQDTAQADITAFAEETDGDKLAHPYFENVRTEMAALITSAEGTGRTMSLKEAYEAAVWSNPDTRTLIQAELAVANKAKRREEAKAKAAEAKKSSRTNLDKKGVSERKQQKPTGSIDDTMNEALADIKAAGQN